jgi:hypothetical protein
MHPAAEFIVPYQVTLPVHAAPVGVEPPGVSAGNDQTRRLPDFAGTPVEPTYVIHPGIVSQILNGFTVVVDVE